MLWQLWRHSYAVVCSSACGRQSLLIQNELVSEAVITGSQVFVYIMYIIVHTGRPPPTRVRYVYTLKIHTCMYNLVLFHLPECSLGRNHNRSSFAV